jgi:hypothetical protein
MLSSGFGEKTYSNTLPVLPCHVLQLLGPIPASEAFHWYFNLMPMTYSPE